MDKSDHDLLIELHTMVLDMRGRLLGNGQPGECSRQSERISWLERRMWMVLGASVVLGALSGWFSPVIHAALRK